MSVRKESFFDAIKALYHNFQKEGKNLMPNSCILYIKKNKN